MKLLGGRKYDRVNSCTDISRVKDKPDVSKSDSFSGSRFSVPASSFTFPRLSTREILRTEEKRALSRVYFAISTGPISANGIFREIIAISKTRPSKKLRVSSSVLNSYNVLFNLPVNFPEVYFTKEVSHT